MQPDVEKLSPRRQPRSRRGCAICKKKRVKCDESKPSCGRCVQKGLDCPGYQQPLTWSTRHEVLTGPPTRGPRLSTKPARKGPRRIKTPPSDVATSPEPSQSDPCFLQLDQKSSIAMADPSPTNPEEDIAIKASTSTLPQPDNEAQYATSAQSNNAPSQYSDDTQTPTALEETVDEEFFSNPDDTVQLTAEQPAPFALIDEMPDFWSLGPVAEDWLLGLEEPPLPLEPPDITPQPPLETPQMQLTSHRSRRSSSSVILSRLYGNYTPAPQVLELEATRLVEHYFREVCTVYSCFDSSVNPFRTTAGQLWTASGSVYHAIQSMAAGHLANANPSMRKTGLVLHKKSMQTLETELELSAQRREPVQDRALFTMLLLGLSACWLRPGNLGKPFLHSARTAIMHKLDPTNDDQPEGRQNEHFFVDAMVYWELMMAFVDPEIGPCDDEASPSALSVEGADDSASDTARTIYPHPWTGISPESQILLTQVGRLIRRVRWQWNLTTHNSQREAWTMRDDRFADALEKDLIRLRLPPTSSIANHADAATRTSHLIAAAEATRLCGLLSLYRFWPKLFLRRVRLDQLTALDFNVETSITGSNSGNFAIPGMSHHDDEAAIRAVLHDLRQARAGLDLGQAGCLKAHLVAIAVAALDLIALIPATSGARPQQLLCLAIAASEVRSVHSAGTAHGGADVARAAAARARRFAWDRLALLRMQLPSAPLQCIMEIVQETWNRSDAGVEVYWLDVMEERGWQTVMG